MRVFVTGATGYVGSAVAARLRDGGHEVTGLARSDAAAARLAAAGVAPVVGELRTPASYVDAVADHDAVIHAAFEYRADGSEADDVDQLAVGGLIEAMHRGGRCRQLVYTSNAFLLSGLGVVNEDIDLARATRPRWRLDVERRVLAAGRDDVATAVVRVGAVYGGAGGSFPGFFEHARATGSIAYVGDGSNRWSLIHRDDLAALYGAIVERGGRGVFHGVDGTPLTMREVMTLVARASGDHVEVRSVSPEQASALPYHASVLMCDLAMDTARARALGWAPSVASFRDGAALAAR